MRSALVCVIAVGALLGLSGCTPGANDQLKRVVEAALLPGMDSSSCEWGASSFENEPSSWYGCWDYVSGEPVHPGPGEVFVDVWTAELRDGSGDACAGLPAWEE